MILLEGESPAFDALRQGFRDYYKPVGRPEELDIEHLAWLTLCLRRVQAAEIGEIEFEKKYNSRVAERERQDREEAATIEASVHAQTLLDVRTEAEMRISVQVPSITTLSY